MVVDGGERAGTLVARRVDREDRQVLGLAARSDGRSSGRRSRSAPDGSGGRHRTPRPVGDPLGVVDAIWRAAGIEATTDARLAVESRIGASPVGTSAPTGAAAAGDGHSG